MLRKLGISASVCVILLVSVSLVIQSCLYITLGNTGLQPINPLVPVDNEGYLSLIDIANTHEKGVIGKKRVLIVTMEVIGPSKGGGIATAYTAMSEALASAGHIISVLYTERYHLGEWEEWIELYQKKDVELIRLWDFSLSEVAVGVGCSTRACVRSYRVYQWLHSRIRDIRGGFDIVHFHDNGGIGYFCELAKHQGQLGFVDMAFIAGAHGPHFWERLANEFILDDHRHLEVDHMERKMAELSDIVVSPSAYMIKWMRDMKWELPRWTFVHQNILPMPSFELRHDEPEISLGTMNEVVFFGRLERRKGLFTFLNALALIVSNFTSPLPPAPTFVNFTSANITNINETTTLNIAQYFQTTQNATNMLHGIKVSFMGRSTLVDAGTMAHQLIERWCFYLNIECEVMSDMSQQEAVSYLKDPGKFAVIASPVDNSPNTVLECLSYGIRFIASNTGGIPELVHPDDRPHVLFDPYPDSLARLLESILVKRVPLAAVTAAVANEIRTSVWVDLHSSLISRMVTAPKPVQSKKLPVTVLAQLWCTSNISELLLSVQTQDYPSISIILGIPTKCHAAFSLIISSTTTSSQFRPMQLTVIPVIEEVETELLQRSWYTLSQASVAPELFLFLDPSSTLMHKHSLSYMVDVMDKTNAAVVTASFLDVKNNNTVVVYPGCSGGHGVVYNCFGGWNMLVNATVYREIAPKLERGANDWVFYSFLDSSGYRVESALETHFRVLRVAPPVQRSTSLANLVSPSASSGKQQIVRNYANRLPAGFEPFVTVASHCLFSNSYEPPSHEALTQHIELVFVRGFPNSGTNLCKYLLNTLLSIHVLNVSANFHTVSSALRGFISPPFAGSSEVNTLHTKKWYLMFVRSFMLAEIPSDSADAFMWTAEVSSESMNPIVPGASYIKVQRDGRNTLVSYYHQHLWCYNYERQLSSNISDNNATIAALCYPHRNETLFYTQDLQAFEMYGSQYFKANPSRLFAMEAPFRRLAKAWAMRVAEDDEAVVRIVSRAIDARVLEVEYEQLVQFPQEWTEELSRFLGVETNEVEQQSISFLVEYEGEWELELSNTFLQEDQKVTDSRNLWQNFFSKNATYWFKQEAGDLLIKKNYAIDMDWSGTV